MGVEATVSGSREPRPQGVDGSPARGWSISFTVTTAVILAMLLVATAVLTLGWMGARNALMLTATRTAGDSGVLVNERARRMLEPVQATVRQLAQDPIASATTLPERLKRLYVLSDELVANPLLSALYVGYRDGEFLLVRPLDKASVREQFQAPPRSNFMVQSRAHQGNGRIVGEYFFYSVDSVLLERRVVPTYQFDPRTRPWFAAADATTASVLSDPYVFFSTRQVGLSVSQLSRFATSVVGVDVVLDELSDALGELRVTPHSDIALVNEQNEVLAYPDLSRTLKTVDGQPRFNTVESLGAASLQALAEARPTVGKALFFEVNGQRTLGVSLPFDVWESKNLRLLITVPEAELMKSMIERGQQLLLIVLVMVMVMLPLGWMAGRQVGRSLGNLTGFARRLSRFDFSGGQLRRSFLREVNALNATMSDMSDTIHSFLNLSQQMASEPEVERMLDQVLTQLVAATRCQGGAAYLWDHSRSCMVLAATEGETAAGCPSQWPLSAPGLTADTQSYWPPGTAHTEVELRGRNGALQGVLVLLHADDRGHRDPAFLRFAHQLSGMLALSIETRQLIDSQRKLLDAVIRLMADAIDAKSPYTGGHCERVPELATLLVDRMSADRDGPYADFSMTEDERYEFYLGAWLHDCGKVTSPEHIVDKATKLEVIHNRIHEVRTRFEVLWRDAEIAHLKRVIDGTPEAESQAELARQQAQLQSDFAFVAKCNVGGEFMADEAIERLGTIGSQTWWRHFDDRLGLAIEEARRLEAAVPQAPELPVAEPLLADRPEHLVPWGPRKPPVEKGDPANRHGFDMVLPAHQQNMGELYNLSIRRGTLTDEDRFKINDHIVQTLVMLKGLPWPQHLARVPDIAATHHEKMDGKGYPRRLPASQLTVADRVMALADVFEALTAADRPYKPPKTLTESLRIMAFMCKDQHLDTELFRYFLHSGLWRTFAERYMQPAQIDGVDVAALEKLLPASPPIQGAHP